MTAALMREFITLTQGAPLVGLPYETVKNIRYSKFNTFIEPAYYQPRNTGGRPSPVYRKTEFVAWFERRRRKWEAIKDKVYHTEQVIEMLGITKQGLAKIEGRNGFPKKIVIHNPYAGLKTVYYPKHKIDRLAETRKNRSSAAKPKVRPAATQAFGNSFNDLAKSFITARATA
jgi:hypothetical protein